jgi:hypothetical protein
MADESKNPICPSCGSEAKCFCRERYEWASRLMDYTLFCPKCGHRETETKHGGYTFFIWGIHLPTACPFCLEPPSKHAEGAKFEDVQSGLKTGREEIFPAYDEAEVCPECGKGQIVCTYLGDRGTARNCNFVWEHTCTNCSYDRNFTEFVECEEPDRDTFHDERGPGKAGGCPGPHK